eukprot:3758661-Rhodomonas_salina.1
MNVNHATPRLARHAPHNGGRVQRGAAAARQHGSTGCMREEAGSRSPARRCFDAGAHARHLSPVALTAFCNSRLAQPS